MRRLSAPVVISGAGPVGLTLALGLARCGVKSLVLEKRAELSGQSKALAVQVRTVQILQRLGVLEQFQQEASRVCNFALFRAGAEFPAVVIDLSALSPEVAVPEALLLPQERTEHLLYQACHDAGVEVLFEHETIHHAECDGGMRITARGPSGVLEAECGYFAICEGSGSHSRERMGLSLQGKTYAPEILLADVRIAGPRDPATARFFPTSQGILVAVQFQPGVWRIIDSRKAEHRDTSGRIGQNVRSLFGRASYDLLWESVFQSHQRVVSRFVVGHCLLAGDAAHLNSPAGGQGMNGGIHDAFNLAWKLAACVRGADEHRLLRSYNEERRYCVLHHLNRVTDQFTRLAFLDTPLRDLLTRALQQLSKAPLINRRLALRMGMLDHRYGPSALLESKAHVGTLMPDFCLVSGGEQHRLSELLFPEAALLLFDDECEDPWNTPAIVSRLSEYGVQVLRCLRPRNRSLGARFVDESDWWRLGTKDRRAVLVRPDGYIGWQSRAPDLNALEANCLAAIGYQVATRPL
jgi:2-polyprenyl-6-methoxyphenol hydroxylase-like FAD-dependent oxidoreductase